MPVASVGRVRRPPFRLFTRAIRPPPLPLPPPPPPWFFCCGSSGGMVASVVARRSKPKPRGGLLGDFGPASVLRTVIVSSPYLSSYSLKNGLRSADGGCMLDEVALGRGISAGGDRRAP